MSRRRSQGGVVPQLAVMLGVSVLTGVLMAGLAIPFAGLAGVGANDVKKVASTMPLPLDTAPSPERTRILTSTGQTLATLYTENRVQLSTLDNVSPLMLKAIIAIEDHRFYEHGALDVEGTLRAFVTNQASGDVSQGGSSITQQLVKMTLVEQAETDEERAAAKADTYGRKLRELRYALWVEEQKEKDQILLDYLNIAYFGDGAYGIEAAAQHYFGVRAVELDLRQSAMLAGLVKNPTGYDPTNHPKRAKPRRDTVLDRMAQLGQISTSEAAKAKKSGLGLRVHPTSNGCVASKAEFFCDFVRNWLLTQPALGKTRDDRNRLLNRGGLTIRTTVDMRMQKQADKAVKRHVNPTDQALGALAMVEPGTGRVKAIAQSRPMGDKTGKGQTYLNYIVPKEYSESNGGFQGGSTFKAFVLSAAIEKGLRMSEKIKAPPKLTLSQESFEDKTCPKKNLVGVWEVSNSTTNGMKDMYTGTRESVNTFYAQLEQKTGLCKPWQIAKKLGLENPGAQVPSWTLGIAYISPLEMAEAYATFAARGVHCNALPVTKVSDRNGTEIEIDGANCKKALKASTADAVNDVLRGVIEGGFADNYRLDSQAAGKTGTTQSNESVWFIGYTPELATASMVAGANSRGNPISLLGQTVGGQYVAQASGTAMAAPMWYDAMNVIQSWLPNTSFRKPDPKAVRGTPAEVPRVGGMDPKAAKRMIEGRGFTAVIEPGQVDSEYAAGTVAFTSPKGSAFSGDTVTIYVSDGSPAPARQPKPSPKPTKKPTEPPKPGGGDRGGDGD
ncbi:MAG: transglycosylase domain-containing protein [Nocardioidaceae bacterium]